MCQMTSLATEHDKNLKDHVFNMTSNFPSTHTYNESMSPLNDDTKADFKCLLAILNSKFIQYCIKYNIIKKLHKNKMVYHLLHHLSTIWLIINYFT